MQAEHRLCPGCGEQNPGYDRVSEILARPGRLPGWKRVAAVEVPGLDCSDSDDEATARFIGDLRKKVKKARLFCIFFEIMNAMTRSVRKHRTLKQTNSDQMLDGEVAAALAASVPLSDGQVTVAESDPYLELAVFCCFGKWAGHVRMLFATLLDRRATQLYHQQWLKKRSDKTRQQVMRISLLKSQNYHRWRQRRRFRCESFCLLLLLFLMSKHGRRRFTNVQFLRLGSCALLRRFRRLGVLFCRTSRMKTKRLS